MASDGSMAEALVYLKNVKYNGELPSEPAVLDQKGNIYMPHVFGMVEAKKLLIKNSDATLQYTFHAKGKQRVQLCYA